MTRGNGCIVSMVSTCACLFHPNSGKIRTFEFSWKNKNYTLSFWKYTSIKIFIRIYNAKKKESDLQYTSIIEMDDLF